jgi:hypothetical protein
MGIFISHINEEARVALVLKELIENIFPGQWNVFVSSDSKDIPAGSKWLDQIDSALDKSKLLIVLCSSKSISRPWINFEAGCGWIKRIPIIPICYSGMTKESLPAPLSMLQGIDAHDKDFSTKLLNSIVRHLDIKQIPKLDFEAFNNAILKAMSSIPKAEKNAIGKTSKRSENANILQDTEIEIIKKLAEAGDRKFTADQLAGMLNIPFQKAKYYLTKMVEKELINDSLELEGTPTKYMLDQSGREYLIKNDLL